jgi:vacuolar-type H+-ATPase subunit B/Vma2
MSSRVMRPDDEPSVEAVAWRQVHTATSGVAAGRPPALDDRQEIEHLRRQGHYPAIDILHSVSRLTSAIAPPAQQEAARKLRAALAAYRDAEDLIQLGAYVSGSNPALDASIRMRPELIDFLRQHHQEKSPLEETLSRLETLSGHLDLASAGTVKPKLVAARQGEGVH